MKVYAITVVVLPKAVMDALPESNAIAKTPDGTESYVDIETAYDLELIEMLSGLSPVLANALTTASEQDSPIHYLHLQAE
ncbi:hypothetical protein AB6D11_18670 [Vibrio splendidus]